MSTPAFVLPQRNPRPYAILALAIFISCFAAVFIRLTQGAGMPSLVIAPGRLLIATLVLTPLVLSRYRHELNHLHWHDVLFIMAAGLWLAIHFIALIVALEYTTVMLNQVIINSIPVWVGLLETFFLRERFNRLIWAALGISVIGGVVIGLAGGGSESASDVNLGNFLALIGALSGASYLTMGRHIRSKVSGILYAWLVFLSAGAFALIPMIATQMPIIGYSAEAYLWLAVLAIAQQLVAHTGFNYAVGYISATLISTLNVTVTVGATIVAFLLFSEMPTGGQLLGSAILVVGALVALAGQNRLRTKNKT